MVFMASPATNIASNEGSSYSSPPSKISESLLADDSKKWREKMPIGIRFQPNDQVLANYYLAGKVSGRTDSPIFKLIREVDAQQCEPSLLSSITYDFGDGKMYFFTQSIERSNVDRHVPGGFWKNTGNPSFIKDDEDRKKIIANKTTLFYCKKDHKSEPVKTKWIMNEYMLLDSQSPKQKNQESEMITPWTICVVYPCNQNQQPHAKKARIETQPHTKEVTSIGLSRRISSPSVK